MKEGTASVLLTTLLIGMITAVSYVLNGVISNPNVVPKHMSWCISTLSPRQMQDLEKLCTLDDGSIKPTKRCKKYFRQKLKEKTP